jgi:ATP-binding cassette subfamily F protein 3
LYRERKAVEQRLAPVEEEIHRLEGRLGEIEMLQVNPEVYSDPERAGEIGREKSGIEERLAALYVQWEELATEMPE